MLLELLLSLAVVLLIYQRWVKRDVYKLGKQLNSGVWTLPFIGHSYLFFGDNHTRMKAFQSLGRDAISKKNNGLTSMWHGNYLYTMVADPDAAELVLKSCLEKDDIMKMATLFLGNGSIFAPVKIWRPRRKVLAPSFSVKYLKHFMSIFVKESNVMVDKMKSLVGTGPISAFKYFTAYTMDAVAESTLGYKMGSQKDTDQPFLKAFDEALVEGATRLCQPWLHSDLVYTNLPVYARLLKSKKFLWDFLKELIRTKRNEMIEKVDNEEHNYNSPKGNLQTFLESLIRLSGGDEGYTETEIVEELMVIMIAGNDTSAVGASFISVLLSRHPEVQEKIYKELQLVFADSDRPITYEDLPHLKYLDAVIRETLRLYPPVPVITRKVEKDVVLPCGIKLVPGTGVIVNIWALHRNPRYWGDDVKLFRPERFLDTPLMHPAAFMPFSHGPRNCVGYQYAMMSLKTVLSTVLRRYRILPATTPNSNSGFPPLRLKFDLMMKDEDDFQIRIESRR
ncbi:hypothetical protein PYW08_015071 [Mythimna loreyi]|uniref:Uncharacterized protein n=1 Tax=Mythimna loreyi TaxID=667449 RepID=A0ACC2R3W6_9NEOP|nr:hypothetical protein PYW08_015071 [Mythimna loreyi]